MPFSVPTMLLVNSVRVNRNNPLQRARSLSNLWKGRFAFYLVGALTLSNILGDVENDYSRTYPFYRG